MGDRIRYLRKRANMTQEELGAVIGVQKSAIRKYEKGTVENIKRSSIQKMATVFGVSPCYLMGWDNEISQEKVQCEQLIKEKYGVATYELLTMYNNLDIEDKAEIRGEIKHMLKADKYAYQKELKHA